MVAKKESVYKALRVKWKKYWKDVKSITRRPLSKIIRNNRTFKILLKNSLMNEKIAEQIKHTEKHLIDLED